MELQRRKWPMLEVGPLEPWRKLDIVEEFLRRSLRGRRSAQVVLSRDGQSSTIRDDSATFLTGVDLFADETLLAAKNDDISEGNAEAASSENKVSRGTFPGSTERGLVLFPSMIERIVSR